MQHSNLYFKGGRFRPCPPLTNPSDPAKRNFSLLNSLSKGCMAVERPLKTSLIYALLVGLYLIGVKLHTSGFCIVIANVDTLVS